MRVTLDHGQVDWPDVERRGRRRDLLVLPAFFAFFGGIAGLTGRFAGFTGTAGWIAAAAFFLVFLIGLAINYRIPSRRAATGAALRVQHALRQHVDPGPGLRERADAAARVTVALRWVRWWLFLLIPVMFIAAGIAGGAFRSRPLIALLSALGVLAVTLLVALRWRWGAEDARRWLADPPGPPRDVGTPRRWERWLRGGRAGLALLGILVASQIPIVVVLLLDR